MFARPGIIVYGTAPQVIALPALTFLLTLVIAPTASIALGMMVVAACPGGNASNVLTQAAHGDAALSVSLTAPSSALAVLTTPFASSSSRDSIRGRPASCGPSASTAGRSAPRPR